MNTHPISNQNNGQLFDLVQRKLDGAWLVWTRKSLLDLGMMDRHDIEGTRMMTFTDAEWADFLRQPHITEPTVWVIAATYPTRPTVDTVLAMLGVKRRPRVEQPQAPNRPKPRKEVAVAA
jgi:hypothetical protein